MSGRRDLLIAVSNRESDDPWAKPLTFTARTTDNYFYINYVAGTSTALPTDDVFYRLSTKGPWTQYLSGQTIKLPYVGDTLQVMSTTPYFSRGTSNDNVRIIQASGYTIDGNINSLLNWTNTLYNSSVCLNLLNNQSKLFTTLYIPTYSTGLTSHAFYKMLGSVGWNSAAQAPQSIHVKFTDWGGDAVINTFYSWLGHAASGGWFYKPSILPMVFGVNRIPEGWTVVEDDVDPTIPYERATCITQTNDQYIDTGINARSGLTAEVKFSYTQDGTIFGANDTDNSLSVFIQGGTLGMIYGSTTILSGATLSAGSDYVVRCVAKEKQRQLSLDNISAVNVTTTDAGFSTVKPLYLGLTDVSGDAGSDAALSSIHYCRIWDESNALLFDGWPVLDNNSKPALYDRVQKQLLYSHTNTDFSYTQDYIKDRIHFQLDAIDNVGTGAQDPNSTEWVDLIGGNNITGIDLTRHNWNNNCLNKTVSGSCLLTTSNVWEEGGAATIEVCCYITTSNNDLWVASMRIDNQANNCLWQLCRTASHGFLWEHWSNNMKRGLRNFYITRAGQQTPANGATIAYTVRWKTDGYKSQCYNNGELVTDLEDTVGDLDPMTGPWYGRPWGKNSKLAIFGAGFRNGVGSAAPAGIYAIRIYNRVLEPEELRYNSMLDRKRFGIGG